MRRNQIPVDSRRAPKQGEVVRVIPSTKCAVPDECGACLSTEAFLAYVGSELIAQCSSAKRLSDWALWDHDAKEVRLDFHLKLIESEQ